MRHGLPSLRLLQVLQQRLEAQAVAERAEARDHAQGDARHERVLAELLPCEDVREVHLDDGQPRSRERIAQRDTRVSQAAGIDEDAVGPGSGLLDAVDQRPLVIRLEELDLGAPLLGRRGEISVDLLQAGGAVDLGLAGAEQVEVRTVQDQDPLRFGHTPSPPAPGVRAPGAGRAAACG